MATINDPVFVDGSLIAGNIQAGSVTFTAVDAVATSVTVSGLTLTGTGDLWPQVTAHSTSASGRTGVTGGFHMASINNVTETSFDIVVFRDDVDTSTQVFWFVTRNP